MNMSKLFKFLGIGSAIGTVVYGVIKYKNDQKFKEKVDGVAEKAVEKACDFTVSHPKAALGIVVGTVVGGSVLAGALIGGGLHKHTQRSTKVPVLSDEEREELQRWSEENGYDDNLEAVKDLAKDMNLHDDEFFMFAKYIDDSGERKKYVYQGCVKDDRAYERKEYI